MFVVVEVFLGSVTMRNTHVRMDVDPDPFSFDARVNASKIAISNLMDCNLDGDPISLFRVNGVSFRVNGV